MMENDTVPLPVPLDILEDEPGVHQGRDVHLGRLERIGPVIRIVREVGEEPGDLEGLGVIDEAHQHRADLDVITDRVEVGDGIDCHNPGLELLDELQHHREVHLEAVRGRPDRVELSGDLF